MARAFILLGGNLDSAENTLLQFDAIWEANFGSWIQIGSTFLSEPWGSEAHLLPKFWNQARELETQLCPHELMLIGQYCELHFPTNKRFQYDSRYLDFDIIEYNSIQHIDNQLILPHLETPKREFALRCMDEIAGEIQHSKIQKSYSELYNTIKHAH